MEKLLPIKARKKSGIYLITNKLSGKKYIGQSKCLYSRCNQHRSGKSGATKLQLAVKKYGINNFSFEILEFCDPKNLDYLEEQYISFFETTDDKHGYNILESSNAKRGPMGEETKEKLSLAMKVRYPDGCEGKNNPFYGKKHGEETRKYLSKINTGKKLSDKTCNKISESLRKTLKDKNIKRSKKHRDSQSTSLKGKNYLIRGDNSKKIIACNEVNQYEFESVKEAARFFKVNYFTLYKKINKDVEYNGFYFTSKSPVNKRKSLIQKDLNGNFIKKWNSISSASRHFNGNHASIINSIKRGGMAFGFRWEYSD